MAFTRSGVRSPSAPQSNCQLWIQNLRGVNKFRDRADQSVPFCFAVPPTECHQSPGHAQPSPERKEPLSPPACPQPCGLVSMGRRGIYAGRAKKTRPIFLRIGYSTCHWCHVMEQGVVRKQGDRATPESICSSRSKWIGRSARTSTGSTWLPFRRRGRMADGLCQSS